MKPGNEEWQTKNGSAATHRLVILCFVLPLAFTVIGCRRDMFNQPKGNPLRESNFFPDGAASRPLPAHTVSHSDLQPADSFYTGMNGHNPVATFPYPVTRRILERGKQRFEIYCVPCHGESGDGEGMVVQRGLPASPPLDLERLRTAPIGHFVDVIVRGYGIMLPQAAQVAPDDRWAIAAYTRALELSQHAELAELPPDDIAKLRNLP